MFSGRGWLSIIRDAIPSKLKSKIMEILLEIRADEINDIEWTLNCCQARFKPYTA